MKVFLHLHQLSLPPVFRPTPVSADEDDSHAKKDSQQTKHEKAAIAEQKADQEDEEKDPIWPAGFSLLWLLRATCLKERGNWLLTDVSLVICSLLIMYEVSIEFQYILYLHR